MIINSEIKRNQLLQFSLYLTVLISQILTKLYLTGAKLILYIVIKFGTYRSIGTCLC
jgi:hypothetical protein